MPAQTHIPDEWLMDYAAGTLDEAVSVMVASHLSLCPHCRCQTRRLEATGGVLLDQSETIPVSEACRSKMMAMLDAEPPPPATETTPESLCRILPAPVRSFSGCGIDGLHWEKISATIERVILPTKGCSKLQVVRFKAGSTIPKHDHRGSEMTLILSGSIRDQGQLLRRGDIAVCEPGHIHTPKVGEAEDCLCLVMTQAPLRLCGLVSRWLGRLAGF